MSLIDKAVAALTPPVSDEKRAMAHTKARAAAEPGDWLSMVLDHHEEIEAAFTVVRSAPTPQARRAAQRRLGVLLTGHSMAEEAVLYPALVHSGKMMNAELAYLQQVAAKMQLAALEHLDPESEDYLDKLGHLEGAVLTHVFEEENGWFTDMKAKVASAEQAHVTARYREDYDRYMRGGDEVADVDDQAEARSFAQTP